MSPQYSLQRILALWAAVTLPMALLVWVLVPWLIPRSRIQPGILHWLAIILGMVWQFAVAVIALRLERRDWTWASLRERLWLVKPTLPGSGRRSTRAFLCVLPAILFVGFSSDLHGSTLDASLAWLFPQLQVPAYTQIQSLVSPRYTGQWWLLGLALLSSVFNYFLGEALLFHGVLLPRMLGVFGRWAWLANAVLFGLYHVHMPLQMPSIIVSNMAYSLPAQRYLSSWLAVLVHGFEGLVLLGMTLWVVLGQPILA